MKKIRHIIPAAQELRDLLELHKVTQKLAAELVGISHIKMRKCVNGSPKRCGEPYTLTPAEWFYLKHRIKDY